MRETIRRARWLVGLLWFGSWFELYLEIYRHHHVTWATLLGHSSSVPGLPPQARPGGWLQTVLACSRLTPLLFLGLLVWTWSRQARRADSMRTEQPTPFPFSLAVLGFGLTLCVLGTINQLIWRGPIAVDMTLQTGNGGFIILGAALVVVGRAVGRRQGGRA